MFHKHTTSCNMREKIALSLIFKKKIKIINIRNFDELPGIKDFEIDLLCFVDKFTNGTIIKINENGTKLLFFPGIFKNQKIEYKIKSFRSISYYIEFFFYISLFLFKKNEIKLTGTRSSNIDNSLELVLYMTIPLLRKLGFDNMRFKVYTLFFSRMYNTELVILFPTYQHKKYFALVMPGTIHKIRLLNTYSDQVFFGRKEISDFFSHNPVFSSYDFKILELKIFNSDIKFQTIAIISETTEGCIFGEDITLSYNNQKILNWNKIIAKLMMLFLDNILFGDCIDAKNHIILFLKMLNKKDNFSSIFSMGKLTFHDVTFLRNLKKISGKIFSIKYNGLAKKFCVNFSFL
nr:RNA 3'phosphate cyclase [Cryptomonas paramecium]